MTKQKMNNLIGFYDFVSTFKTKDAKKTARTDTALDVLADDGKKGGDVDKKNVTDKSTTVSNGLAKDVIKTSGDYDDGAKHVSDDSKTTSNGLAKVVVTGK